VQPPEGQRWIPLEEPLLAQIGAAVECLPGLGDGFDRRRIEQNVGLGRTVDRADCRFERGAQEARLDPDLVLDDPLGHRQSQLRDGVGYLRVRSGAISCSVCARAEAPSDRGSQLASARLRPAS